MSNLGRTDRIDYLYEKGLRDCIYWVESRIEELYQEDAEEPARDGLLYDEFCFQNGVGELADQALDEWQGMHGNDIDRIANIFGWTESCFRYMSYLGNSDLKDTLSGAITFGVVKGALRNIGFI